MSLIYSVITSFFIVISFWFLALFQSNIAQAFEKNNEIEEKSNISEVSKQVESKSIQIAGIKQRIKLDEIKTLWDKFNKTTEIQNNLKYPPKMVYVVYQGISKNYQEADVTIGYNLDAISNFENAFSIDTQGQNILLAKKHYSDFALAEAWKDINYSKNIQHILEVHSLDLTGEITASKMLISYQ